MREFILAMRAIWSSWSDATPLKFEGDFYRHTLMTPFFSPGANKYGPPKVFLAAVGEKMTEVAGEVADGIIIHGFTTERYVKEVTLPALERGLARAGRGRASFEVSGPLFVVTGATEQEFAQAEQATKQQIAFYGSTPAYRGVLELHGRVMTPVHRDAIERPVHLDALVLPVRMVDEELRHVRARIQAVRFVDAHGELRVAACGHVDRWSRVIADLKAA